MSRLYSYVGPSEILEASRSAQPGTLIEGLHQLLQWLNDHADDADATGLITATFVIDPYGKLRLASRRSEHVACASGGPVQSAGEITFSPDGEVVEVNNHSTGFCPEPDSWTACCEVFDSLGVKHPGEFSRKVIFRLCPTCNERNVVKDDWYVCDLCGEELPEQWNFQ